MTVINAPLANQQGNFRGYDILPAVQARRILLHETHSMEDCLKQVFTPARQALQELANQNPGYIIILNSIPYSLPQINGQRVNLDLITPTRQIFHLGTVADKAHTLHYHRQHIRFFQKLLNGYMTNSDHYSRRIVFRLNNKLLRLKQANPFTICRNWHQCLIPADRDEPTYDTLAIAARNFFAKSRAEELSQIPIRWLKNYCPGLAQSLIRQIDAAAQKLAEPQSTKDRQNIILQDLLEESA